MREFHLFAVDDDDQEDTLEVSAIHDDEGYQRLRQVIADQYNLGNQEPNIQVQRVDLFGDRSLILRHYRNRRQPLGETTDEVLKHVARLWGYNVKLESVDENNEVVEKYSCEVKRAT
jgi:spore cortex formation protein SpoVR/YcgB (stage V sporulation)